MPEDKQNNKLNLSPQEEASTQAAKSKRLLESILMELNKSVKAFSIYPENHPSLKTLIEKSFQNIKILFEDIDGARDIAISVERGRFYNEAGEELSREGIADLANEFFHRRIKKITLLLKEITPEDWIGLVKFINTAPKEILNAGGAEKLVIQQGLQGVYINEIKYEDIVDMVTELGKEEEGGDIDQEDEEASDDTEDSEISEEMEVENIPISQALDQNVEEPDQKQSELDRLLNILEEEQDNTKYREIVKRLVKEAVSLRENKDMDNFIRILYHFSRHSAPDSTRPKEQQDISHMALKNLFDPHTADIIVEAICIEGTDKIGEIKSVVLGIGEDMVPYLLDSLVERRGIGARRNLYNLILEFGETASKHIETKLNDDRWFVVRQMVSLLGTIGSSVSIDALRKALNYPDTKVKREVVKALAMLKTKESIQEVINILSTTKPPLSIQAIISLGAIKERTVVPTLIDIIKKRDIWGKNHEVKREAINALGNIGDNMAVSVLSNILKTRRRFWGKEANTELRSLAALALGKIGGEGVVDLLQDALEHSKGVVYQSCIKALKAFETRS